MIKEPSLGVFKRDPMKNFLAFFAVIFFMVSSFAQETPIPGRWSEQKAAEWNGRTSWYCGFNYIPAYAINYTAMWDKTTFDEKAIDKELGLAEGLGMNCLRAVLQYAVYEDDPIYFLNTLDKFMVLCAKHHIQFMPALFDDCSFGITSDPKIGKQPEPLDGWYAWAWSPSPGHGMVTNPKTYPELEKYVKAVIGRFKDDKRIMLWDLYNEPTNGGLGNTTLPLLRDVIVWARAINPIQPLSIGIFDGNPKLNDIILTNVDVITFHNYGDKVNLTTQINELKKYNRPIINTEWMNRYAASTITDNLSIFYENKVGCMLWGLVNGKTQTNLPWGHRPGDPVSKLWQHDLFHSDFAAYDQKELEILKSFTNKIQ